MITTSFMAVMVNAETTPEVWTDSDEYAPGETVYLFGDGFVKWVPVEIELEHPDLGIQTFVETPMIDGSFVFDGYQAEWVANPDLAVNVTVTQVLATGDLVATTQFWDPGAFIEGWTLAPHLRWTHGDIKGYNEGDSVPFSVVLSSQHLGAIDEITVEIGFDFIDVNSPTNPTYGIDFLTQYWTDPPTAAFNGYTNSSEPFWIDPSEGMVTYQERMPNEPVDEGGNQFLQVWRFTVDLVDGYDVAIVRFGAHLAVSADVPSGLGASFYPGSALHVRMIMIDPEDNQGHRDVPIMLGEVMTPPEMTLDKVCDPCTVVEDDEITFELTWSNIGQAAASCLVFHDDLPWVIDIDPTSFLYWTSANPTPMPPSPMPVVSGDTWDWSLGYWPGTGYDGCSPVLVGHLSFTATVNTNEPGCYYNWANTTYQDNHGGYYPPEVAWCKFCIISEPSVMIEKIGPEYAHVGDVVTYEYTVTNTGDVDLFYVDIVDSLPDIGLFVDDETLLAGETETFYATHEILITDIDPLPNTATVTGVDVYGRTATDDDSWKVDILHPDIDVYKTADMPCAMAGETVTYEIWVVNPSIETDLYNVTVVDSILGLSLTVGTLLAGETYYLDPIDYLVLDPPADPLVNIVTAEGEDILNLDVCAQASATVEIYHPDIAVDKGADKSCAEVGELVTYWINVSNPSWDTVMWAHIVDSLVGLDTTVELAPGEYFNETFKYTVLENDADPLDNTVYVEAWDPQQHLVRASASWSVDIYHPLIEVTKEGNLTCAAAGDTITYWINVTNPSTDTPMYAVVDDPMFGGVIWTGLVAAGTTFPLVRTHDVVIGDPDPLVNTVTVTASDPQDHERTDSASWRVDIYHPDIDVVKWSELSCAEVGETITYWINVSNPTIDTPMHAMVYDTMFGGLVFDDWIVAGDYENMSFKHTVSESDLDHLFNYVSVDAWDPQGHYAYAEDFWEVDILHPAIEIVKSADVTCAAVGEDIHYTITVTNPSADTTMSFVQVTDDMFGGVIWTGSLAPLAHVTLDMPLLTYTVMPDDPDPLPNTAYVYALDTQGHDERASSSWSIDVVHPDVLVDKVADKVCAAVGELVAYTIYVTNPQSADVWLNGSVTDDMLGQTWYFTNLKPGQTLEYTYTMGMPDIDPFKNTVEVVAYDHQLHEVTATDSWSVDVVHPEVQITKEADKTCAAVGELVTYWINVTNPSWADVWLNGSVTDDMLGQTWYFTNLMPGQTIPYTYTMGMRDVDPFKNTVTVVAYDHQEHLVSDDASWSVDVVHPDVLVTKEADKTCAAVGELVRYWINVTNPDTADVWLNGSVTDDVLGQTWTFTNLEPGVTLYFTYTMAMPDVDPFENTVVVEAMDHQLHEVGARASWSVDVVHPMIEVTKTADVTCEHVGETIWYTITVSVPKECDVWMNGTVSDPELGWVESFFDIMPGGSVSWTIPYLVTEDTADPFTNTAHVDAYDHQDHLVTDDDSWTVEILKPDILVTKIGPEKADIGQTITYYVNVTNTGDTPLLNVTVYDTLMGTLATYAMIAVGETKYITYTYVVPAGTGTLDNIVIAYGEDKEHFWVDDTADWTVFKYGVVTGYKFADINQDAFMDDYEPGVSSWLIVLSGTTDSGESVYRTRLTDSYGYYEFKTVDAGVYTVSEVMLTGWINIAPISSGAFSVGSGTTFSCDFGNLPTGSVSGYKWHDVDIDGYWDAGELGVEDWTIYLYGYGVDDLYVYLETTTDASGYYEFTGLLPGIYDVSEEMQDGWFASTLTTVHIDVSALVPFDVNDINFGNAEYGRITGFKWLDEYMNGYRDGNEPLLPGWTIVLEGVADDGTHIGPLYAVTDASGYYSFDNLKPGVYTVAEVLQAGWYNVTPASRTVTVIEGSDITCVKFGNVEYGKIDGWKFLDWDMDTTKDGDEPGILGWEITIEGWLNDGTMPLPLSLDGCTHIGPTTITTGADGYWMFDHLLPGIYTVSEAIVDGWYHTTPTSVTLMVCSGSYIYDIKFGNVPYTCFYGYKVEDMNGNGRWDDGELGIPGWTIVVEGVRNDGVPFYQEYVTDEKGYWETCYNILPGTYWVYELVPDGWIATSPAEICMVPPMALEPMAYEFVFLNFELGEICGYKYEDMNGNGILDDGDTPIEGWVITLSGPVSGTTTTEDTGYFEFDGLTYGTYTVTEEDRENWVHMTPSSYTVQISSGSCVCLDPFLNVELSKIWGYKFEDVNSNGVWDDGEPGISGWTIYMLWDNDLTEYSTMTGPGGYWEFDGLMPSEWYLIWEESREGWTPTTQDWAVVSVHSGDCIEIPSFGNFENVDITVFKYEDANSNGEFDEGDTALPGWSIIVSGPGIPGGSAVLITDDTGHASVEVTAAGTYTVTEQMQAGWCNISPLVQYASVLSGYVDPEVVEFGNFRCVTITIFKYEDVDSNGVFDGDDIPLSGWTFYLMSMMGEYMEVVTGLDGTAQVTFCEADLWMVQEEDREGWCVITPEDGYYTFLVYSGVALGYPSMEEQYRYEFGNFRCVEIVVFKYWDQCSNGWYDPAFGDVPLEGWYMELYGPDGKLLESGYTDEYGYINWTVCAAGTYIVIEEDRCGWSHITPLSGYYEVEVLSGDRQMQTWFGNYLDVEVPIFKYEDVNSNGEYDDGDVPLGLWYFELVRDDGTVYSGYTDEDGMLVLIVNRSGMYTLYEEMRDGWTPIYPASGMRLVNVVSGTEVLVQEFGNFHDVTITVFKFEDMDGDGYYDDEDMPLAGWSFIVTGPWSGSGTVIVTGLDGCASIVVDRAGMYHVEEVVQPGWTPTTDTQADVSVYSGCQPNTAVFGNFEDVIVRVFKYEDVNSNGVYDAGDRPLEGWTIEMYSMDYGFLLLEGTGPDGYATFVLQAGGAWIIQEYGQSGWCQITPVEGGYWYVASSGDTPDVFEFGNFRCVLIDVFKYEDANSNGVYDAGDSPIPGWFFWLLSSSGAVYDYGCTDPSGHLYFQVCQYDVWTVVEEDREGWTHISPASGSMTVETPSSADPATLMFGNFRDVWIVVQKYHDRDSDGVYDEGIYPGSDLPIGGWMFTISGPGVTNAVAYTDSYGYAYFLVNRAGTYTVTEEDREGWVHVNPLSGTSDVTVVSGDIPMPLLFGNFELVRVWVFKYDDILANGWYGPGDGDIPLEGWKFTLYIQIDDEWVYVAENYTDEFGYASFLIDRAGFYMIQEELQVGWSCITHEDGSTDFLVEGGQQMRVIEFGNFKLGKISGYKWNDLNGNGEWDEGEPALSGWTIWFECVSPYYLTGWTVTNEDGYYEFTGLPSGTYWVWEIGHAGWIPTSCPEVQVVIIGHTEARVDFFNFQLGCIWGYKYEDVNGNGILDDGDIPLAGWTISLSITTGVIETPEGAMSAIMLIAMTTTDANGYYSFCGLGPGIYVVSEEARTGWVPTNDPSETVVMTSGASIGIHTFLNVELSKIWGYKFEDVNSNGVWDIGEPGIEGWTIHMLWDNDLTEYITTTGVGGYWEFDGLMPSEWYLIWEESREGWTPTTQEWAFVSVHSGDCIEIPSFGNFEDVDITVFKYEDVDGNGVFNAGDHPIEGWEFVVTGPCFDVPLVVLTDADGKAYVTLTVAGEYVVDEEDRAGWMHVIPIDGTTTIDIRSGDMFKQLEFGNFMLGQITGQKFYDWNLNGLKDGAEPGLANWVIWINGTLVGGGYLNFTRLTDSNGLYSVAGLPAGTYVVSERLEYAPFGWVPMTSPTVPVDVRSGTAAGVSFGNAVFGVIEGYKFYDKDLDGWMDGDEPGLSGWTIILEGYTDQGVYVYRTDVTDGSGKYVFEDVQPGVYDISEVLWPDWAATTLIPVHVSVAGSMVYFDIWVNIGNVRYATVFGYKFLDTYTDYYPYWPNGLFDEDEFGIGNWEITLQGWTNTGVYVDRVEYTENGNGDTGYYEFGELLPGMYWVNETLQWGFYATKPISNLIMVYPFPIGPVQIRIDFGNLLPAPDPEIKFVLKTGVNLWSSPLVIEGGLTASGLAAAIGPTLIKVSMFDTATQTYRSFIPGVNKPGSIYDFPIVLGAGYFVVTSADTVFTLTGELPANAVGQLAGGVNIMGYTELAPTNASALASSIVGAKVVKISYYDPETGKYKSFIPGVNKPGSIYDFTVTQGRAYFVVTDGAASVYFAQAAA